MPTSPWRSALTFASAFRVPIIRLYTAGDFLDEPLLDRLRDAGLDELRMSIKLDVLDVDRADEIIDDAVDVLARAKRFIPQVMVEMP